MFANYVIGALLLAAPGWQSLTGGKNLDGWRPDGNAEWRVQDGAIIGRQGPNGAGGNLYTVQQWADFDLELEFKVRWPANSGIWFRRSAEQPGYQADIIDQPSYPDTFSGSLVAMGTGFLAKNSDAKSVNKEDWNRLRISAACDKIVIALNGKTVIKNTDSKFLQPGSIGIEVHPGKQFQDMEIWVRRARVRPGACNP
jgi:Domain of Unknown Function (DUF1080)